MTGLRFSSLLVAPLLLVLLRCGGLERNFGSEGTGGSPGATGGAGGSAGESSTPDFTLETADLPSGEYNVEYSARLEASEEDATFTVTSGALPDGLTLASNGRISGVPTVSGEFTFEVTATLSDGRSATREYTLRIRRKRWLAYISDETDPGHDRLFLIDVTQALLPKTTISTSVTTGTGVSRFSFSEQGEWLGYTARSTTGELAKLFVADVSGTTGKIGVPLTHSGEVEGFAFRPDGTGIVYHWRETGTAGEPWELRYIQLLDGEPSEPVTIGPSSLSAPIHWIHNSLLVYGSGGDLRLTRVNADGEFSAAQSLLHPGSVRAWNPETEAVVLGQEWPTSCGRTAVLLDLAGGGVFPAPPDDSYNRWPVFSPDLTRVVLWNTTDTLEIFRSNQLDAAPLGSIAASACSTTTWNPAGNLLITAWGGATEPRLAVTEVSSTLSSHIVEGEYEMPYSYTMHWTRNDQLVFASDDHIHRVDIVAGESATATVLNPPLASAHSMSFLRPAPNGRGVAFLAPQQTAGRPEVFVASTDSEEPEVRRPLVFEEGWQGTETLAWSADSSRLAFVVRTDVREYDYASRLYVVDMVRQTATAVAANPAACYTDGCTRAKAVAFQP